MRRQHMPQRYSILVGLCLVFLAAASLEAQTISTSPVESGFLIRSGAQLLMDGKPFRAVGVNKRELLDQYVADLLGQDLEKTRGLARKSLDGLAARGIDVVRVCGCQFWPADMLKTFAGDRRAREIAWSRFDEMVADCAQRRVRLVLAVGFYYGLWADLAHESLQDFITNPHSRSRQMFDEWLGELVARYKNSPTILFWELFNEGNLYADLRPQLPEGVLKHTGQHITPGPVVRDARNHFSSEELAAFNRETARLIKSIDPNHLVGSGDSLPRVCAWHLWMGSLRRSSKMDWSHDTNDQQIDYIRLISPDAVDLISVHYYIRPDCAEDIDRIGAAVTAAQSLGKPLYFGEMGPDPHHFRGEVYSHAEAFSLLRRELEITRLLDVPIALVWAYDEYGTPLHEPVIRPDRNPEVMNLIERLQAEVRRDPSSQKSRSDRELREIVERLKGGCASTATQPK